MVPHTRTHACYNRELGAYLVGLSAELFRRPEPAVSASDITEDAWSPLLSISITEDAQLLKEIDQFFYDQQLGIDDDSNRYRRMSPSDRFLPAVGKKRKQLQPLFARDTALFSPTAAKDNNDASPRSTAAAAATAGSSQYIHYYDPTTTSSTSKMLLGSHCPRRCVQLARSLHPSGGGGGGVSVVNSAFLDRRDVWSCRQHSSSSDTALAALMGGRDHRRDYDDDDDDDCALDAADEWGVESMQELARLYQQQVGAAGEENSNFVDLLGRGGGGGGCDRSDEEEEDDTISRAIADTVLTRIILRYL